MKHKTDCSFETESAMLAENLMAISEKLREVQQAMERLRQIDRGYSPAYHPECSAGSCCNRGRESELDWCLRVPESYNGREAGTDETN